MPKREKPRADCAECYEFEERAAIMEYLGKVRRQLAERMARSSTCFACDGGRGTDLLDRKEG